MSLPHFCTVSLATFPSAEGGGWAEETGVLLSELGQGEVLVGNWRAQGIQKPSHLCPLTVWGSIFSVAKCPP